MPITFSQKILIILFLVLVGFAVILNGINAYSDPPNILWCFGEQDCNSANCIPSIQCDDDRPGYDAACSPTQGQQCPVFSRCWWMGATEQCYYTPINPPLFHHENCCDEWGWNNARTCGGCCGPAANCVGYDPSAPYNWHDNNEIWQCDYNPEHDSIYNLVEDCDSRDGWYSGHYRDYYCSNGDCQYILGGDGENQPPNIPTLIAPPHNTWINYNPTFQATVSDPDGNQVRAHFGIISYGAGISDYVDSGQTASWGPVAIADGDWYWRSMAQDTSGLYSD